MLRTCFSCFSHLNVSGRGIAFGFAALFFIAGYTFFTRNLSAADTVASVDAAIQSGDLAAAQKALAKLPAQDRVAFLPKLYDLKKNRARTQTKNQSLSIDSSRSSGSTSDSASAEKRTDIGAVSGAQGGGAGANFDEIINLIKTTVPASWDDDGGSDTVEEYFQGVYIDSAGTIGRIKPRTNLALSGARAHSEPIQLAQLGVWQNPAELRWISLNQLQASLEQRNRDGKAASFSMELLGGLTRIDFVAWDPIKKDWSLGGPAGNLAIDANGNLVSGDNHLPPVLLEDLMSLAPHVFGNRGLLGCTIDPTPEKLAATHAFITSASALRTLARRPETFVDELRGKLGLQDLRVFGLPADSPTGLAMLIADQHMKRLGFGLEAKTPGLVDYLTATKLIEKPVNRGLVRWWFAIQPQDIASNEEGTLFALAKNSVQVLSEQQWLDSTGKHQATGNQDPAADAFARSFTEQFEQLQEKYPIYGRLRHIFDLTIALEIIRGSNNSGTNDLTSLRDPRNQPHLSATPKHVESIATWTKLRDGQTLAIASGGVTIYPNVIQERIKVDPSSVISRMPSQAYLKRQSNSDESWWR